MGWLQYLKCHTNIKDDAEAPPISPFVIALLIDSGMIDGFLTLLNC